VTDAILALALLAGAALAATGITKRLTRKGKRR
jgi:hypothetical protein